MVMTKEKIKEILSLSREEKIELVQTLWDDISTQTPSANEIPEEHKKLLERTLHRISKGETQFNKWEDVKAKYGKQK